MRIVLHTPPGDANRVAVALDRLAWPDIVATIAGDDTIFLSMKDAATQRRAVRQIGDWFPAEPPASGAISVT